MFEEYSETNPVHERYKQLTKEIISKIDETCKRFFNETPKPEEFEYGGVGFTADIAKKQGGYQWAYRNAQNDLELYKAEHAKVLHVVRSYYSKDNTVIDDATAKKWGYFDGVYNSTKPLKQDLDYFVQADDLYIAVSQMLAAQQRLVDTYKDIDTKLIERGRQYKTAMELIRYKAG